MEREGKIFIEHVFHSLQSTRINVAYNDCPLGSRFPYISSTGEILPVIRRVSLVEQELLPLPEHPSTPVVLSGVRVAQSLDFSIYSLLLVFCRSLCVLLFIFWSLYCPTFIHLQFINTSNCILKLMIQVLVFLWNQICASMLRSIRPPQKQCSKHVTGESNNQTKSHIIWFSPF